MSSLALMRWLETAPERYDSGMRLLTLGRVRPLRETVARAAAPEPGAEVLELGCGTGTLTALLLARGARVTALDQNPAMLEQARAHLAIASLEGADLLERTASEIDGLPRGCFDAVVASLSLSEMSRGERAFLLREAGLRLRPGGRLVIGDEVRPEQVWQRTLHSVLRGPQALLGWLLAGSISRPIPDLAGELGEAGFRVCEERRWLLGSLAVVTAEAGP